MCFVLLYQTLSIDDSNMIYFFDSVYNGNSRKKDFEI